MGSQQSYHWPEGVKATLETLGSKKLDKGQHCALPAQSQLWGFCFSAETPPKCWGQPWSPQHNRDMDLLAWGERTTRQ